MPHQSCKIGCVYKTLFANPVTYIATYTANICYITIAVYITADHNQQNDGFNYLFFGIKLRTYINKVYTV